VRVLIVDGYTDEPAGLGVPPFIDVYPRYIAGAVWCHDPYAEVFYMTIDEVRRSPQAVLSVSSSADLSVLIAGVTVPGKYLSGAPATIKDALSLPSRLGSKYKAICGPAARFGFGSGGGSTASIPRELPDLYDYVITGDPEIVVYRLLEDRFDGNTGALRESGKDICDFAVRGARIIQQHPFYPSGLICEIETYRGCPRAVSGGCSFCTEPSRGPPDYRPVEDIADEVAALSSAGAVNFRIGRQPDLLVYGSDPSSGSEYPPPDPGCLKRLFSAVRSAAPSLRVLHIDNINPGTIYNHPSLSEAALSVIVANHTPGDVAALGIESTDEEVIRRNNLKVGPEGAFEAISIINKVGRARGENGMPHLLPGVNFVYGLAGETERTYDSNLEFMKRVLDSGLMVRRINLRQVMVLPGTALESTAARPTSSHRHLFIRHKMRMRSEVDEPMLQRVVPEWTVLRDIRTELVEGNMTWARQIGSYPVLVALPRAMPVGIFTDVAVLSHGPRSVCALPCPIKINSLRLKELESIPGIGAKRAVRLLRGRPFRSADDLRAEVDDPSVIEHFIHLVDFSPAP